MSASPVPRRAVVVVSNKRLEPSDVGDVKCKSVMNRVRDCIVHRNAVRLTSGSCNHASSKGFTLSPQYSHVISSLANGEG